MGPDPLHRARFAFNVSAMKTYSRTFLDELAWLLVEAGVGVMEDDEGEINIFQGLKATVPEGAGPYLSIVPTGGTSPEKIHNQSAVAYQKPSAQILVRAENPNDADEMIWNAYEALTVVVNQTVDHTADHTA